MQGVVFLGNRKVALQSFADPPSPAWVGQRVSQRAAVFSSRASCAKPWLDIAKTYSGPLPQARGASE